MCLLGFGADSMVCDVVSEPAEMARRLCAQENGAGGVKVVFCTYHSLRRVCGAQALHDAPPCDFAIADEARLPLIPLVVTPEDTGIQDSTPIIEAMEERFPEPSIHPTDATARFVSALIEEFGDEWGNKWMFHMRWAREVDQLAVSRRFAAKAEDVEATAKGIRERMVPRTWFVGANEVTAPQIEQSLADALPLIDAHLSTRPYLFGARPAFADFGLWSQVYECGRDPTAGALVKQHANVVAWVERMLEPKAEGEFEDWAVKDSLTPLLRDQVAAMFLPWSNANAEAIADGAPEFDVTLKSNRWTQRPQKYHARSLAALKARYGQTERAALDAFLEETGCLAFLR